MVLSIKIKNALFGGEDHKWKITDCSPGTYILENGFFIACAERALFPRFSEVQPTRR